MNTNIAITASPRLCIGTFRVPACLVYSLPAHASPSMRRLNKKGNELETEAYALLTQREAWKLGNAVCDFSREACDSFVAEFERDVLATRRPCIHALLVEYGKRGMPVPAKFASYYADLFVAYCECDRKPGGAFHTFRPDCFDASRGFLYQRLQALYAHPEKKPPSLAGKGL